ncbi:MAG: rod shape-determining protein MreD [Lachnospiraceae bacterium]|nr:rod shape-determining protein MreD [Lachnospiraceae bacterium]
MIQKILIAISIPFFFLLQACVFTSLELGNVIPNLMVLLVCVYGFFYGEKTGAVCGFFAGLLMDIFFSEMLGLNALIIMFIGYINGGFSGLFYAEDIRLPLILITLSDATFGLMYYIFTFLMRGRLDFVNYSVNVIFPEIFYTLLVSLVIYPILLGIDTLFRNYRIRKERERQQDV